MKRLIFQNKKLWVVAAIVLPVMAVMIDYHICMVKVADHVESIRTFAEDGQTGWIESHDRVMYSIHQAHPIGSKFPEVLPMKIRYWLFERYIGLSVEEYMIMYRGSCNPDDCELCKELPEAEF